jgi:hypothetical protein
MGIINREQALKEMRDYVIDLHSGPFNIVLHDILQRLHFAKQVEFAIYIKLKQVEAQFNDLGNEFSELYSYRIKAGEIVPVNPRSFLQYFFAHPEQWEEKTPGEIRIKDDAQYFRYTNEASEYLKKLSSGATSETDRMLKIKEIYISEEYKALLAELLRRLNKQSDEVKKIDDTPLFNKYFCDRNQGAIIINELKKQDPELFKPVRFAFIVMALMELDLLNITTEEGGFPSGEIQRFHASAEIALKPLKIGSRQNFNGHINKDRKHYKHEIWEQTTWIKKIIEKI